MNHKIEFILHILPLFILLLFEASCFSGNNTSHFVIVNKSDELIINSNIEICGQLFKTGNIKSHEEFNGTFVVKGDSHYKIAITFESGKEIKDELGYVTNGFGYRHTIIVTGSMISISDTKIK